MCGRPSRSGRARPAPSNGAVSRMRTAGASSGCQSAGCVPAKMSGAQGKAQAPAPGHHLPRRRRMSRWQDGQRPIFGAIARVAAEKFLREAGQIKLLARCRFIATHACLACHGGKLARRRKADHSNNWGALSPQMGTVRPLMGSEPGSIQSLPRRVGRFQTRSYSPFSPSKSCAKIGAVKLGSSSLMER